MTISTTTLAALTQLFRHVAEEHPEFGRTIADLAGTSHSPGQTAGVLYALAGTPASPAVRATAPLPLGSGQRRTTLPPPDYDPAVFASAAYEEIAATSRVVHIYIAAAIGLAELRNATATCVYKAGTTVGPISKRIDGLNAIGYAGWHREGGILVEAGNFRSWRAEPLPLTRLRPANSPVSAGDRCLDVRVPASMSDEDFDIAVTTALAPVSIAHLLTVSRFSLGLLAQGFDGQLLERYSPKADGSGHKRAAELVRLQPHRDADELATMAEAIIANHVATQLQVA